MPSSESHSGVAPPRAAGERSRWRSLRRRLIAWAVLTLLGSLAHWATWIDAGPNSWLVKMLGETAAAKIGNVFVLPSSPGWLVTIKITGKPNGDVFAVGLAANAIGWAFWLALIAGVIAAKNLWVGRRTRLESPIAPTAGEGTTASSPSATPPRLTTSEPANLSRRRLLANSALGIGGAAVGVAYVRSTLVDPWSLRIARYAVPIRDLPASLDGVRLVQICDTHLGPRMPSTFVAEAVAQAIDLKPDAFVLVGDYVHRSTTFIQPAAALFAPLVKTGRPVLGVLGNHDWYASGSESRAALTSVGVRMIDNTRIFFRADGVISAQPINDALCIAGLGDYQEDTCDLVRALESVSDSTPRVLLSHNPDAAELPPLRSTQRPRIDLMLCGHTHGGQVRVPFVGAPIVPSAYGQKYAHGLAQGPACPVITSAGVGMSILPVRFNVPPEIVEITLQRV